MRLLFIMLIIGLLSIHCQRQKPKPMKEKKITAESIQKPVIWDTLYHEIPMLSFPFNINASTYFKGAVEFEYVKKFFEGKKVQVKEGDIETIQVKDERSTSFYYIGKFKISDNIIGTILYNGSLQEFYIVTFEKSTGNWIDALEVAKIHKKEKGSEILECTLQNAFDIQLTYQFLSKVLNVDDIPPTKLQFKIQSNGKIIDLQPKTQIPATDSLEKVKDKK